ncbi:MAG: hypothetical protein KDA24_21755 [Deltaproteobacteria bacterium]|nr:hypothetical protein [Deltaproteobacteria bacterium]
MRVLALSLSALFALPLAGCPAEGGEDEPMDLRRDFPASPDGAYVITSPDYVIPGGTEKQFCVITTYTGPDVGIVTSYSFQSQMGHHATIFGTNATERDFPDGTSWDCTTLESLDMTSLDPIIIGGVITDDTDGIAGSFSLPDGMAAPLKDGQRIILQSHYVNTRPEPVLVKDQNQFEVVPEAEVTTWSAPLIATVTDFSIPANTESYTLEFDCNYDDEYELLFIGGHLHEWGKSFRTSVTRNGVTETVYEVEEWEPVMRDAPLYNNYERGEFVLAPEDTLTTECTWTNNEDEALEFPAEMCVTFAMAYPARVPIICDADVSR